MHYQIIKDEKAFDDFLNFLPAIFDTEVYYLSLFGRHKYCHDFPNVRDDAQLARFTSSREHIKEKVLRLHSPIGSYKRDGLPVPEEAMALYIGLNPKSLVKANSNMLIELATRIVDGRLSFNPISLASSEIHTATGRKLFVDFDFDDADPQYYTENIQRTLPEGSYRIIKTRGGFHLIVILDKVRNVKDWYNIIKDFPGCDVKGSNVLTPVPGCVQGGFVPFFWR